MTRATHQLHTVVIGDPPEPWAAAGFTVTDQTIRIGETTIHLTGGDDRGINRVGIDGVRSHVDGLPFTATAVESPPAEPHPNHVTRIDHVVVISPAIDRTTTALCEAGIELRRERRFSVDGVERRQHFFWLGDVILELAGDDDGDGPAVMWGLALSCSDLDTAAGLLGDKLGTARPAVQEGRRIATLRTHDLGISVPIVLMTPHRGS